MRGRSEPQRLKETRRWLRYAREYSEAASAAIRDPSHVPRHACFDAQQAAEKALKAVLTFLSIRFPKQHDLDKFHQMIPPDWTVAQVALELEVLTG